VELGVVHTVLLAHRDLLLLINRTGGVGEVGLPGAELLEPAAGAGLADRGPDVGVLLLEQPSMATVPEAPSAPPPQALSAAARAMTPGTMARRKELLFTSVS
jgi:hypothetical protein